MELNGVQRMTLEEERLLEEKERLDALKGGIGTRLSASDLADIMSAVTGLRSRATSNVNTLNRIAGGTGSFSLPASGLTASGLQSYMKLSNSDILKQIIHLQGQSGLKTVREHSDWYNDQGFDPVFFEDARTAFIGAQKERRAEDPYQDVGTLWKPGTHEAKQYKNKEEMYNAREAGYTSSTRPELYSNVGTLWNLKTGESKDYKDKQGEYLLRQEGFTSTSPPPDEHTDVGTLWDSDGSYKTYKDKEDKFTIMEEGFNRTSPDAGYDVGTLWNWDTGASANYTTREQEVLIRQRGYKHTNPKSTTSDQLRTVYDTDKKRLVWRLDSVVKAKNAETEDYYLPANADRGVNDAFVMAGLINRAEIGMSLEFMNKMQQSGLRGITPEMTDEEEKWMVEWMTAYSKDINKWHSIAKMFASGSEIGTITVGN